MYLINFNQLTPHQGGSVILFVMPCYKPLLMIDDGEINPETGKHRLRFAGRADFLPSPDYPLRDYIFRVPCNRCIGCRLDYARQWSNRMVMELVDNPNALFITLTYDEEHVNFNLNGFRTLVKRDCQLFLKRLRKRFSDRKIRFFLAGEYGPKTWRPHYHGIFYGLSYDDFPDLRFYKYNKLKQPLYISDFLANEIWQNGFCTIGSVTKETCSYTARYMLKKQKGNNRVLYDETGVEPEFTLSSRRPGIGLDYLNNHEVNSDNICINVNNEVLKFPIPNKLLDKVLEVDENLYLSIKAARRENAFNNEYLEWIHSDLDYLEYLDLKETEFWNRIKGISASTRLDI